MITYSQLVPIVLACLLAGAALNRWVAHWFSTLGTPVPISGLPPQVRQALRARL